jgi:hypothetical protein
MCTACLRCCRWPRCSLLFSCTGQQFLALFGAGSEDADFTLQRKEQSLSCLYATVVLMLVLLFEMLPYLEEFVRGFRARRGMTRAEGGR